MNRTGKQLLPFVLIFERELFPRLTYMQDLITHIHDRSADKPRTTSNILTYDPLPDSGIGTLPRQRTYPITPRPTVDLRIFDNPHAHWPGELGHDDLMELF